MDVLVITDAVGWVGAILLLVAYGLVSFKRLEGSSIVYQIMNAVAGVLLAISTFYRAAYPSSFLNVVWAIIAVAAIAMSWRK